MFFVYVLYSLKDSKLYIGYTIDLNRRMKEHHNGEELATKYRRPFELIYYEAYMLKEDALGREKFLKSGPGHKYLKKQSKHFFENRGPV